MEDANGSSDSEKEFDQQELEVALYSQIHFDSNTDSETHYQRVSLPLKIGVKELPTRITPTSKKPLFGGEFIAFSSSVCEDDEEENRSEPQGTVSHPEKDEAVTIVSRKDDSKDRDFIKLEDVTQQRNSILRSSTYLNNKIACQINSPESKPNTSSIVKLEVKSPVQDHVTGMKKSDVDFVIDSFADVKNLQSDGSKNKTLAKGGNLTATPVVKKRLKADKELKEKEILLPFFLTKTPLKPKVAERENVASEKDVPQTSTESVKKKKVPKPVKNNFAKLEGFLQLPSYETDSSVIKCKKKARLSKTDAAVKPRKPAVFLRRPPAVVVKYRQDSDTNTDYSDSEASISASPVKARQNILKDSSQNSASSYDNLTKKDTGSKDSGDRSESQVRPGHQDVSLYKIVKNEKECVTACSNCVNMCSEVEDDTNEEVDDEKCDAPGKVEDKQSKKEEEKDYTVEEMDDEKCDIPGIVETTQSDIDEEMEVKKDVTDEEVEDLKSDTGKDIEDSSDQEESTSGSEDTESSDPSDFMTDAIEGLEFNLDRGVNEFSFRKSDADNWKIDEKDQLNITSTLNRYFIPRVIQCRNCKADGHLSRDCPQPLKRRCIFCAQEGHIYQACPNAICFNCSAPGHRVNECKERKQNWHSVCNRCWMSGHLEEKCPDRWRQYHITVNTKGSRLVTAPKDVKNPLIFCYNCGKKGHLGFECRLPRMNQFVLVTYPFIAWYDTKSKRKEMKQGKEDLKGLRTTGHDHREGKKGKLHSSSRKNKISNRDDLSQQSKGRRKRRKHGQEEKRVESEDTGEYNRKHYTQNREEEHGPVGRKKWKWEDSGNVNNSASRYAGNNSSGVGSKRAVFGDHKSSYRKEERQFKERDVTDDDILNDFESHQVSGNEWWEKHDKPARKRRRRNREAFSSNVGNDWQRDRQKHGAEPYGNAIASQESQMCLMRDNAQSRGRDWRQNKKQQSVQGKQGQGFSMPELNKKHKIDHLYRTCINKEVQDGNFSNYMQNRGQKTSFSNTNFGQTPLHHAASWPVLQKAGSNLSLNKSGFQARNERFVAMKRHCDITVSFRK